MKLNECTEGLQIDLKTDRAAIALPDGRLLYARPIQVLLTDEPIMVLRVKKSEKPYGAGDQLYSLPLHVRALIQE